MVILVAATFNFVPMVTVDGNVKPQRLQRRVRQRPPCYRLVKTWVGPSAEAAGSALVMEVIVTAGQRAIAASAAA